MTAYELADALQETEPYYSTDYKLFDNAANMLRQQADRIAELEKDLHMIQRHYNQLNTKTKPLSNDEILEMTIWNKNLYELYVEMEKEDMIAFARAVEERHGIK